jgi:hypothetical protein
LFASTTSRTLYFEGVSLTSNTDSRISSPSWMTIGSGTNATYNPNAFTNGKIAEVAIWNAVLTADEVMSLAKGVKPTSIRPQSLFAYVPLVRDVIEYKTGMTLANNATSPEVHTRRYE